MRKVLQVAALVVCGVAFAQQDPEPGQRLQEFQRRMNLTPAQTEQIRPILVDEAAKLREIRAQNQGRRKRLRALRGVQQDAQRRIQPILTRDQKAEWKKIRAERREAFRENRR